MKEYMKYYGHKRKNFIDQFRANLDQFKQINESILSRIVRLVMFSFKTYKNL